MSKLLLISLITNYAIQFNLDPYVALAVAQIESSLNPNAVGDLGEIGLFQVRPEFSYLSANELRVPENNIIMGILKLKEAQKRCIHKKNNTWLTCYNIGITGAKRLKHPEKFEYVIKVNQKIKKLKQKEINL